MSKPGFKAILFVLAGLCIFVTACSSRLSQPTIPTAKPKLQASSTPSPKPATVKTTTNTPVLFTPTATVEETPATPTASPVIWSVPARQLPEWPSEGWDVFWPNEHLLAVEEILDEFDEKDVVQYDLGKNPVMRSQETAQLFHNAGPREVDYSPEGTFAVVCTEKVENEQGRVIYHGLQLYRVKEDLLISEISGVETSCMWSIRWAPNESALSFASHRTNAEEFEPHFEPHIDIYVWKTNGSKPYVVGQGTHFDEPGTWSPDSSRLVVEIMNMRPMNPDDEESYLVMYPDGRPPRKTKGQLGVRAEPGLSWLTNDIVSELNTCCVTCTFMDYYVADTGERLEALSWSSCMYSYSVENQGPLISEDQRWFVLDQTDQPAFDPGASFDFTYTLYDLNNRLSYTLSKSDEIFLDFLGWQDNSTFYLVRRPVNDQVKAQPDTPFGMLALDPNTRQMRLVNADIRYAWLSPDNTHIFGVSRVGDQLYASIYSLDGTAITEPIQFPMPEAIPIPEVPKLQSIWETPDADGFIEFSWSQDGSQIAFQDTERTLWLIDVNGRIQRLAEHIASPENHISFQSKARQDNTNNMLWSPQNDHLVVLSGTEVWVVDVK